MKLFKLWYDKFEYDTYDGFIIAAESEEHAKNLLLFDDGFVQKNLGSRRFPDGKLHIEEIKLENIKQPCILLSSFNAG